MVDRTAAVLATLSPGVSLSASKLAERLGLRLRDVNSALAALATDRRIARTLTSDDGLLISQWSLHQPRPKRPDKVEPPALPPIAAE